MRIDINLISALAEELNNELAGGRIEKIQQPAKDIVILTVNRKKVLISCRGNYSRIHLTSESFEMPLEPPMFCMLLRKHISGAVIESICQLNNDRVIEIALNNYDSIGRALHEKLIVELIPKSSNIVLCDNDYMIIDCIKRKDFDSDMYRRVFPGNLYRLPAKKAVFESCDNITLEGSISGTLDSYFSSLEKHEIIKQKSRDARTKINSSIKRIERKLAQQRIELQDTFNRDEIKKKADLITANIYRIKKGDESIACEDYFKNYEPVIIELDPLISPQNNAAKLYKQYNKKKKAQEYLTQLIEKGEAQLEYLYSTLDQLSRASSEKDIKDITDELTDEGFIKSKTQKNKKKDRPQMPIEDGKLLIGRNNRQNDELTFKIADRNFWWFHVKDYHGSHVILREQNPTEEEILQACIAAKNYSEAQGKCAVDYCQVKYVKKPPGALPGKVIYTNYKTKLVN